MGGKGVRRPRGSDKPLSEVFAGIHEEIVKLEEYLYRKCNAISQRIAYYVETQKKIEELRRKMRKKK